MVSILIVLVLFSCQQREVAPKDQSAQPQQQEIASKQQTATVSDIHTVAVQEVIQTSSYTYLKVKEEDAVFWIAIKKREMATGETISFKRPLEMTNFTSKELRRTFETIYFVGSIRQESSPSATTPHQKPAVEKKEISIEPAEGGISIAELFSNRDAYANKVVRIKGQVTKVNQVIMGKNWVHLQDGTGDSGKHDLLITTQDEVALGDVVTFEGTIALNKDFGSGYSYEILIEEAKRQTD